MTKKYDDSIFASPQRDAREFLEKIMSELEEFEPAWRKEMEERRERASLKAVYEKQIKKQCEGK